MIATYNQVRSEMRTKEAEFTRELQRAQYTESRVFSRVSKAISKLQGRIGHGSSRTR